MEYPGLRVSLGAALDCERRQRIELSSCCGRGLAVRHLGRAARIMQATPEQITESTEQHASQ
jgi:hypothetical protein